MGKAKIEMVIRFLKDMQIEKVCVFGEEDAEEHVESLQKVIDDIEMFYEGELEEQQMKEARDSLFLFFFG